MTDENGHSRRTVLQWMGGALVIPLSHPWLAACGRGTGGVGGAGTDDSGGGTVDTGDCPEAAFCFYPGDDDVPPFDHWPVRTVDSQELKEILASWTLEVDGLVEEPLALNFADLVALERRDPLADFHCVEGWSVRDVPWNGVHLDTLLEMAGLASGATHATFHGIGGTYKSSLPLDVAREEKSLLAYGVGGYTLPLDHGFPLRMVVPRLYAYKGAKYVERVEITDAPVDGYWVARGYSYEAEVPEQRLREGRY